MASIWQIQKSPFYICQFRDASGRRVTRSTKQKNPTKARKVAEAFEEAAASARKHELTRAAATKILDGLMRQAGLGAFKEESCESFLQGWLNSRNEIGRAAATFKRYKSQIEGLIEFLGPNRASASIASLTASELEAWRNAEIESGKSARTANFALATIRAALEAAKRKGFVLSNQADAVEKIESKAEEREPFTPEELISLMKVASKEWRAMIALGAHCGLRINDAANLVWENINLSSATLVFWPSKTEAKSTKQLVVALHPELVQVLRELPQGIGKAPLFASLFGKKSGSGGGLSNQFSALMTRAGVIVKLGKEKAGKGRRTRSKGFHSLRHTMISRMADEEIPADVRKAIAGHSSDDIHNRYVHLSLDAQRAAITRLKGIQ
jgi:integrase